MIDPDPDENESSPEPDSDGYEPLDPIMDFIQESDLGPDPLSDE